jgi:ATP-binding cassette, subfamily B (MDR/TAP), member 1
MTPLQSYKDGKSKKWLTMLNRLFPSKASTLKNTGASYFALFGPLHDVQSRLILLCGIVLAVAAGAPLPIIGVIFARIIDAFPPTEDEIHQRISQLLGVGRLSLQFSGQ